MTETKSTFKPVEVHFSPLGEYEVKDSKGQTKDSDLDVNVENKTETKEDDIEVDGDKLSNDSETENATIDDLKVENNLKVEDGIHEDYSDNQEEEEVLEDDQYEEEVSEEDNLDKPQVDNETLPESVKDYLNFYKETGGSIKDFIFINQDLSSLSQDDVIRSYMQQKYPEFSKEDIEMEIEDEFGYDAEEYDEKQIRRLKLKKKKFYSEAISHLKQQSKKYKSDLVSSSALNPEAMSAIEFKKSYEAKQAELAADQKSRDAKRNSFIKESNKVFSNNFKGFEVKLDNKSVLYKPENIKEVKDNNLNVNNLLKKFVDKEGNVTDLQGYHKTLTIASNPESFAKYFYELGKVDAIEADSKESKNIPNNIRKVDDRKSMSNRTKYTPIDINGSQKKKGIITLKDY